MRTQLPSVEGQRFEGMGVVQVHFSDPPPGGGVVAPVTGAPDGPTGQVLVCACGRGLRLEAFRQRTSQIAPPPSAHGS